MAEYIRAVAQRRAPAEIAALVGGLQGWWHRPERLLHGPGMPCTPARRTPSPDWSVARH